MDLENSQDWNEEDLKKLVLNQIEESLNLEYKRCDALTKEEKKKTQVSKDVSALANSAGGTIVYGIIEDGHVPTRLDEGFEPNKISKEWIEHIIQSKIHPRIHDVIINGSVAKNVFEGQEGF